MKTRIIIFILTSFASFFVSCKDDTEELLKTNPSIEYRELLSSEKELKSQLAEAAVIVSKIAADPEVLKEIVDAIKSQPKELEDRVKFKELVTGESYFKSGKLVYITGKFISAFKSALNKDYLKSGTTLIEKLIDAGIEVYIPYPIEDYSDGTDIVVTSHPLDNTFENTGYFVSNGKKVLANDELAKKYPIIIITTPFKEDGEIKSAILLRKQMVDAKLVYYENFIKSATTGDPTADFNNENQHYGISIPKIYCTNDHVEGLFTNPGDMTITSGTVEFDTSTKIVVKDINKGLISFSLPRKYEGYCNNGYSKGWFDCDYFAWEDWQPAITSNSITIFMDTPNMSETHSNELSSSWLAKVTQLGSELSATQGFKDTASKTITTKDFVYGSKPWSRERYKYDYGYWDYASKGAVWGEDGETYISVDGIGNRPALVFSPELKFVTYCQIW